MLLRDIMEFARLYLSCVSFCAVLQGIEPQSFMIKNVLQDKCIHAPHENGKVSLAACKQNVLHQQWIWDLDSASIINAKSKLCLTVQKVSESASLKMQPCKQTALQAWSCDKAGHLTLKGHNLYLSTNVGTKKVLLSKNQDKHSKWQTPWDSPICKEFIKPTMVYEPKTTLKPHEVTKEVNKEVYEPNFTSTTETMITLHITPIVGKIVSSTENPGHSNMDDNGDNDNGVHDQQFLGVEAKRIEMEYETIQHGSTWQTVMLILCPFALMLGGMILALNIRNNKKRKLLSAMPSHSKSLHKGGPVYTQCPITEKVEGSMCTEPDPQASTLRHGEILIEWKDGTVTPLFDPQQN
ncbi:Hypothetical predicted protein [Pelobates cultripes]|uniref:Ricin B lectin domain-containing protein n=2 Tax=Pelobates cultripes TaxID=61616 RepID=A0AAD1SE20_PELCU|nr:Hypothetical predicted protein [Pelobates cultripes]CAH2296823.1 Hypothetical predicted protein [Pelobates cultripes]CAH2296828.1 Hypothetical predicted protein [Pelobates cultripes]